MTDEKKSTFTLTNASEGPRGFWEGATMVMLDPKDAAQVDLTEAELKAAKDTGYFKVKAGALSASDTAGDKPDYERDSLGDVDIHAPSTKKDVLLVIAAYEQADVPEGEDATKADLVKAIEAKRKG